MGRQAASEKKSAGRESQRNRTRKVLLSTAQELMEGGACPTVTDVAEAAGISRATAYRYFPTQEMLLAEVALFSVGGPLTVQQGTGASPAEAAALLVRRVAEWAYGNQQALRTLLRLSLDPVSGVQRPGHRTEWIATVLAPVRAKMEKGAYERLAASLTLLMGIDPVVVMEDIARVPKKQALDALEWAARTLVEGAVEGH